MALKTSGPGAKTPRKAAMAVGTFAVAMGIGFFMQEEVAEASLTAGAVQPMPDTDIKDVAAAAMGTGLGAGVLQVATPTPDLAPTTLPKTLSIDPDVVETSAPSLVGPDAIDNIASLPMSPELSEVALDSGLAATEKLALEEPSCEPVLEAQTRDAALVELSVSAPCNSGEAFTLHHEGMMFSAQTDATGAAMIIAPALSEAGLFMASFADGQGVAAEVPVPALADFDRVVLQWSGDAAFEIHAMEFGANYGEPGHVWFDAPRTASSASEGAGGFLMTLGDGRVEDPRFAQVYTFPRSNAPQTGKVALTVEAEVTADNCARQVEAQTLERSGSAPVKIVDLTLAVPECEAVGDFLVLKNLLTDLTLTSG